MTRLILPPAFGDHIRAVLQAARSGAQPRALRGGTLDSGDEAPRRTVEPGDVARFRLRAMHLAARLPPDGLAAAAHVGLQDSAPRAGLLALAARAEGVGPDAWEHPTLVQIWFRQAAYVVARRDVGVFTRGAMPRAPDRRRALEQLADAVLDVLDGTPKKTREILPVLPDAPGDFWIRLLAVTGKLHIRWDARSVHVLPADPSPIAESVDTASDGDAGRADADEPARLDLARRFLRGHGPAHPHQFAKWAGVSRPDAEETWRRLRGGLVPVSLDGNPRWLLAADEDDLRLRLATIRGVRFLPLGDPYLHLDTGLVVPSPPPGVAGREPEPGISRRLLNSLTGRLLVDGEIAASWGRAARKLTIAPWRLLPPATRAAVTAEAETIATALGHPLHIRWLD